MTTGAAKKANGLQSKDARTSGTHQRDTRIEERDGACPFVSLTQKLPPHGKKVREMCKRLALAVVVMEEQRLRKPSEQKGPKARSCPDPRSQANLVLLLVLTN